MPTFTPRNSRYRATADEYISYPSGGWSPDVPAWELPPNQATQLENFQIVPGKLRVRPAYHVETDLTSVLIGSAAGWVPYAIDTSILTRRLFTATNGLEPQNIHRVGRNMAVTGAPTEDALYSLSGTSVTRTAIGVGMAPGWQQAPFGGARYALTYAGLAAGTLAYNDGVTSWDTRLVAVTPTTSTLVTGAPQGGFAVYQWMNRLWVAGGKSPGGPVTSTTQFFYTNPLAALAGTLADWQDPVSGLYNATDIDADHLDAIVAMASVPSGLLFLRQNSVFILRGTDPTSYTLRAVSRQAGCLDARSVVEIDAKVYFMSGQGLMVTDGTRVVNVSGTLQYELNRQITTWIDSVFTSGGTSAWCTCDVMSDGKILVSFGNYSTGNSSVNYPMQGTFSGVFDPATGAWVRVTTQISPVGGPNTLGPCLKGYGKQLWSLGNTQAITIESNPIGTTVGNSVNSASSLHDVSTTGGAFVPITATWNTRSPSGVLGTRTNMHLKRVYLDYAVSTSGASGQVGFQLTDRINTSTLSTHLITAPVGASAPRQILAADDQHEVADLAINVSLSGTAGTGASTVPVAEVHGIGLELSSSLDLRPTV